MSERDANTDRRRFLTGAATLLLTGIAGCTGDGGAGTATDGGATGTEESPTATATPERDLREANVMAVAVDRNDGTDGFDVTLYHDDDGEDGYANWWQVETLEGEQLGRRELLHAHGTREFTRSETIEVPGDVDCVVVRGHDEIHGYGGRAMVVKPETGATNAVHGGDEPAEVTDDDCP